MSDDDIAENIQAVINKVKGKLKKGLKDIRTIYVKTTMGPPVPVKI
jgi:large subunit ribosomal protein L1